MFKRRKDGEKDRESTVTWDSETGSSRRYDAETERELFQAEPKRGKKNESTVGFRD